jgi:hypothetical protein
MCCRVSDSMDHVVDSLCGGGREIASWHTWDAAADGGPPVLPASLHLHLHVCVGSVRVEVCSLRGSQQRRQGMPNDRTTLHQ